MLILNSQFFPPGPLPLGNHTCILYGCESVFVFWIGLLVPYLDSLWDYISNIIWYLSFSFWLTLLSRIISSCFHITADASVVFHCIYVPIFFIHSSVYGYLGCFHVLATVNSVSMNIGVHVSFWIIILSRYMPRSRLARYIVILFLVLKEPPH